MLPQLVHLQCVYDASEQTGAFKNGILRASLIQQGLTHAETLLEEGAVSCSVFLSCGTRSADVFKTHYSP